MSKLWNASTLALAATIAVSISGSASAQTAPAAKPSVLPDDIVVTASRREEKLNRVPIAVQALSGKALEQLNITNFEKMVEYLPNVRTASRGPGVSSIYIRGLSTDTAGSQILGVAGVQPTVALYLNDAPASTPGRNLDVHATDLQRVEILAGPQGTLFGASAMGGAIRYITNKPDLNEFHAGFNGSYSMTKHGDDSVSGEGFINIPIIQDKFGVRIALFNDSQGGYIDNVPGTYQMPWNPGGPGVLPTGNPLLVNQAIASCTGITNCVATPTGTTGGFVVPLRQSISNTAFVAPHYNSALYQGGRIEATWKINNNWSIEAMEMHQTLKTDGVFDYAPGVGDLQVQQYGSNTLRDTFDVATLTVKGRLGILDMIYTSSYLNHHSVQQSDYAKYDNIGLFVPYYNCDNGVYYAGYARSKANGQTCYAPSNSYKVNDTNRRWTQEFRVTTPADKPFRATAGAFYDVNRTYDDTEWDYTLPAAGYIYSLTPNPKTNVLGLGALPPGTGFVNDILKRNRQYSFYGEASLDIIPQHLTATGGIRYYNEQVAMYGGSNTSFGGVREVCSSVNTNPQGLTTCNYTPQATAPVYLGASSVLSTNLAGINPTTYSGALLKGNLTYKFDKDSLVYATYSEGYRPGGFNRKGCNNPNGTGCASNRFYAPDKDYNYEIGAKLGLLDHQLQVNLAAYIINWKGIQIAVFDQNISNQTFINNLANGRIHGLEGDITYRPHEVRGLTLSSGFSFNDSKLTSCGSSPIAQLLCAQGVFVPFGSPLELSPKFQGNIRARYEWETKTGLKPFVQAGFHYVGSTISADVSNTSVLYPGCYGQSPYGGGAIANCTTTNAVINGVTVHPGDATTPIIQSFNQAAYHTFEAAFGVSKDKWNLELFLDNIGDARPQLFTSGNDGEKRVTTSRPRTVGVKFGFKI